MSPREPRALGAEGGAVTRETVYLSLPVLLYVCLLFSFLAHCLTKRPLMQLSLVRASACFGSRSVKRESILNTCMLEEEGSCRGLGGRWNHPALSISFTFKKYYYHSVNSYFKYKCLIIHHTNMIIAF